MLLSLYSFIIVITWPLFRNYYIFHFIILTQISVVSVAHALVSMPLAERERFQLSVVVSASNVYHNNLMVGRYLNCMRDRVENYISRIMVHIAYFMKKSE